MNNWKKPSLRTILMYGLVVLGMLLLFRGSTSRNDKMTIAGYGTIAAAALVNLVLRDADVNKNKSDRYPPFDDPYGQSTFPHEQPFDPNAPRPMTKEEVERYENSKMYDFKKNPLYIGLLVGGIVIFFATAVFRRGGNAYLPLIGIGMIIAANIIDRFKSR